MAEVSSCDTIDLWENTKTNSVHSTGGTVSTVVLILLQLHASYHMLQSLTHWHVYTHTQYTVHTVHSYVHSHCWVYSVNSAFWQHWTFSKLTDWSLWLCRNVQYCILNPWQAVCFDRCAKAYKRQSGAGTCEAHWVWMDSSEVCPQCQQEVEPQRPSIFLHNVEILVFNGRPVWNKVTSRDYSSVK